MWFNDNFVDLLVKLLLLCIILLSRVVWLLWIEINRYFYCWFRFYVESRMTLVDWNNCFAWLKGTANCRESYDSCGLEFCQHEALWSHNGRESYGSCGLKYSVGGCLRNGCRRQESYGSCGLKLLLWWWRVPRIQSRVTRLFLICIYIF